MQKRPSTTNRKLRMISRRLSFFFFLFFILFSIYANWFVRQSKDLHKNKIKSLPAFIIKPLFSIGEISADLTDSFNLTGKDAICEKPKNHKVGKTFFAGMPAAKSININKDVSIIDKGEFTIAYSEKLHHPVWCAYRIPKEPIYKIDKRPNFKKDKSFKSCPAASSYARTGYDRGHMVPNHAIATRYGVEAQKKTFLMSNIAPQTPELNRGIWREIEHRIADLFTAKYGDIWVIIGAISNSSETLSGTNIAVPSAFYQLIAAEDNNKIRALAFIFEQNIPWNVWPRHYIVSIDYLEEITGLDFFNKLDDVTEENLESQIPTRLWPIRFTDAFKALKIHLN